MDKLREAMETAIEAHWDELVPIVREQQAPAEPAPVTPPASIGAARPARARPQARSAHVPRLAPLPETPAQRARTVPVPAETFARNRLVAAIPSNPEREAYCLLQAALVERLAGGDFSVIGITSPRIGSGKTLTAANLAISLAVDAHRDVLLVDLDLQAPGVHKLFGVTPEAGLEDCLFGSLALPDAVFSPSLDRVAVLPARGGSRSVAQILRSPSLKTLLDTIRARYPQCIVVVDLPPTASRSDATAFEALVDGIVLVVEDGVTREAEYRRVLQSFGKAKLIGTVLNRAESP